VKQRVNSEKSGLLLLNKKSGLTSFDSLNAVKKALGTRKVGHTGTLDKFASGLLVVLAGRAVKLTPWFSLCNKEYEGTIRFGVETDTLDPEGGIVAEGPVPDREALEKALPLFRGDILQAPPLYSAIHVDGKRASERARSGESIEMKKRPVTIHVLELLSWEPPLACIRVRCSSGTYIRSLARDIAIAAGSRAHLAALKRKAVAGFHLTPEMEESPGTPETITAALQPINKTVFKALNIPFFEVDKKSVQKIIQGKALSQILRENINHREHRGHGEMQNCNSPPPSVISVSSLRDLCGISSSCFSSNFYPAGVFCGDEFIAMVEKQGTDWKYGYVYAAGADHAYP
jgi:tRNA pseudouridine55 synthase